jgi:DnaK suppressor protein
MRERSRISLTLHPGYIAGMTDKTDIETRWRPRLEAELEELLASSRTSSQDRAPVSLDQQSVGRLARMDAMQIQAMAQASERRRQGRIAAVRKALERLSEGEYGWCEACGEPIPEGRLEVDATARHCVACAGGKER